jgi:hypothetical protein
MDLVFIIMMIIRLAIACCFLDSQVIDYCVMYIIIIRQQLENGPHTHTHTHTHTHIPSPYPCPHTLGPKFIIIILQLSTQKRCCLA